MNIAIITESPAVTAPNIKEFLIARVVNQKTSCPKVVVPRRCDREGGSSRGTLPHRHGWNGANGATANPKMSNMTSPEIPKLKDLETLQ